jgi:hypothetical protein
VDAGRDRVSGTRLGPSGSASNSTGPRWAASPSTVSRGRCRLTRRCSSSSDGAAGQLWGSHLLPHRSHVDSGAVPDRIAVRPGRSSRRARASTSARCRRDGLCRGRSARGTRTRQPREARRPVRRAPQGRVRARRLLSRKLTCTREGLAEKLALVSRAVAARSAVQVLQGVLLRAEAVRGPRPARARTSRRARSSPRRGRRGRQ